MKQVTLISLYGSKPPELEKLLKSLIERILSSKLRKIFKPYHISQIHGTIIGMEKLSESPQFFNANKWYDLGNKVEMLYSQLSKVISEYLPMTIRLGGFGKSYKHFTSFGDSPYKRSFQLQLAAGKVVLIGWPHHNENFSGRILWNLRKEIEIKCNIRHKYAKFEDNDFFIVLGDLERWDTFFGQELAELQAESTALEENIRSYLSVNPVDIVLALENIYIAQYERETLPTDSTKTYSAKRLYLTDSFIRKLYTTEA